MPNEAVHAAGGHGRLVTGAAWVLLLLGLWVWGRGPTDGALPGTATTGDVAAVGRPLLQDLPPAHAPLAAARPTAVGIGTLALHADVVPRPADRDGAVRPPSARTPGAVGWYAAGPEPGRPGAAVLVARGGAGGGQRGADTGPGRAAFSGLSGVRPGDLVRVSRSDGSIAEFTVESVKVRPRERFDARRLYGGHERGRAELRLIAVQDGVGPGGRATTARVVVSSYLSGVSNA